jgi:hypothetical protein
VARTSLIHAMQKWPEAINTNLWPYALRIACNMYNHTPHHVSLRAPIEIFSGTKVQTNVNHWHHFGAPTYVLDNALQASKKVNRWVSRSQIGAYLGKSPIHSRNVALVLNLETGMVSPQFHVDIDSSFQTVDAALGNPSPPSRW